VNLESALCDLWPGKRERAPAVARGGGQISELKKMERGRIISSSSMITPTCASARSKRAKPVASSLGVWPLLAGALALPMNVSAQAGEPAASRWLAHAPATPPFQLPSTKAAWEEQRQKVRDQLQQLLGRLPPRPKTPPVEVISREDRGDYRLEKFRFDNGAGETVPGYLLLPRNAAGKVPGILYCHWHGGHYDIGKEELFRTNALPIPGGPALVKQGYAVLAIDACCFGERNGQGPGGLQEKGGAGEMTASKFNLWVGRTLWGMIVRDDLMALDYLCSRPEVDAQRVGVTGISMGATRTWWIMALDDRPKTGVAVGCLTRYQDLIRSGGLKYHGIYYFVPGLLNHFDTEAVVALAAPRPMLFQTGDQDFGSPVEGLRAIESAVRGVYRLYDADRQFENLIYPGLGHVYTPEMWSKTVAWLNRELKP
jgi:dienelactone hydrolase